MKLIGYAISDFLRCHNLKMNAVNLSALHSLDTRLLLLEKCKISICPFATLATKPKLHLSDLLNIFFYCGIKSMLDITMLMAWEWFSVTQSRKLHTKKSKYPNGYERKFY